MFALPNLSKVTELTIRINYKSQWFKCPLTVQIKTAQSCKTAISSNIAHRSQNIGIKNVNIKQNINSLTRDHQGNQKYRVPCFLFVLILWIYSVVNYINKNTEMSIIFSEARICLFTTWFQDVFLQKLISQENYL